MRGRSRRSGFTLVELLVVTAIALGVSAVAITAVVWAIRTRSVEEGAAILHGAMVEARDGALGRGSARGIRLLPDAGEPLARLPDGRLDPGRALACSRWVGLSTPPPHTSGYAAAGRPLPGALAPPIPCLVLEASPVEPDGSPAQPVDWWWLVRAGERVRIGDAGAEYTVIGPNLLPRDHNPEQLANGGPPGAVSTLDRGSGPVQYLFLVNGRDDDGNGLIDEGCDGLDNNLDGQADEPAEWETERWIGGPPGGGGPIGYAIRRRPVPDPSLGGGSLPSGVVVDLTTWSTTRERSRAPVDPWTGSVDMVFEATGRASPSIWRYSTPAAEAMGPPYVHLWIGERSDLTDPAARPGSALPRPERAARVVSWSGRTGRIAVREVDVDGAAGAEAVFREIEQGGR